MKKVLLLFLTSVSFGFAQNSDTSLISISNYKLFPGTFSWRGTNTYYDMTYWDSKVYTEGHLKQRSSSSWQFKLNYRLLFPAAYDSKYKKGYPLLVFLHGAGERGNCWETECYCTNCDPNGPTDPSATPQFLNNDHMLQIGAQLFYNAVNLAGSKKIDDPTLNPKAFPGFVLFPQNENSWGGESASSPISHALRIIRLLIKEHNIDPDRIYIGGLSFGGQGVLKALSMADWLFAAAIAMSPIPYQDNFDYEGTLNIPLWVFQGQHDAYPKPAQSKELVERFRKAGGTARYTLYADAGHNTWDKGFKEPDFFSWLLSKKKSDVHVSYDYPFICATNGHGVLLKMPNGFPHYQWEVNGNILQDSTDHDLEANEEGIYRGRFSRISETPTEADWNEWSGPIEITTSNPPPPTLMQIGTTFLPDLNGKNNVTLYSENDDPHFLWERNDKPTELPDSNVLNISSGNGSYRIRIADLSGCQSAPSDAKSVFFDNKAPVNNGMRPRDFTGEIISSSSVLLRWEDPSRLEDGYEIWRKNISRANDQWELATITKINLTFYYDTMLIPGSEYHYKIRAINKTERSDYFPSNNMMGNMIVKLPADHDTPLPPQNLKGILKYVNTIELTWAAGSDESGIQEYLIAYDGKTIGTGNATTTYSLTGLATNRVYVINVSSKDISGNISSPSNQIIVTTNTSGLFYKHSTGAWHSLGETSMKESWKKPEHTGRVSNISLDSRVQEDYFNFEFQGYIYINTPGEYIFYLNSNDGSRLFLDNSMIVDFDGVHGRCYGDASTTSCPNGWGRPSPVLSLSAGAHLVMIQMFEYSGGQDVKVFYNGPDSQNQTIQLPDNIFTSGATPSVNNPSSPGTPSAKPISMTQIELSWGASSTSPVAYEIYRAIAEEGPYAIIGRVSLKTYPDVDLLPGKRYYYRIRAVNENGNSSLSSIVNAKTFSDSESPSKPEALTAESGNYSKVILRWNSSTDNVGIKRYEIWGNEKLLGFTRIPAFEVFLDEAATLYSFYVVAVDLSNNRSAHSESVTNELFITDSENLLSPSAQIIFYPHPLLSNPVKIIVRTPERKLFRIILSDMTGKTLQRDECVPVEEDTVIEIRNALTPGIYMVHLTQGNITVSEKLVFKK
jgi:predicted esterase